MGERTPEMQVTSREEGEKTHRVGLWGKNTLKKAREKDGERHVIGGREHEDVHTVARRTAGHRGG